MQVSIQLTLKSKLSDSSKSVSKAISDVIREFYIANDIKFDFIYYGESSNHINDMINEVTNEISEETAPTMLKHISDIEGWNHELNKSAVIFIKTQKDLLRLHERSMKRNNEDTKLTNVGPMRFKFLVYVEEIEAFQRIEKIMKMRSKKTKIENTDLTFFEFFITNSEKIVILSVNTLYTASRCGKFGLEQLNYFDKESKEWNQRLINYDHYDNFQGCLLTFLIPYDYHFYAKDYRSVTWPLIYKFKRGEDVQFDGVTNELVTTMAKRHNFSHHYTILSKRLNFTYPVKYFTKNFKVPSSEDYFWLNFHSLGRDRKEVDYSLPIAENKYYFLISLNDFYTNYEKLLLAFDSTTWILIVIIFGLTFATIFGAQLSPKWTQTMIFGKGIKNPAYNALGIFFGISQLKMPSENFCRILLIIFIWFCLIIRTCYQSKMFEFITSNMRKPMPQSIDDFYAMNYTIIVSNQFNHYVLNNLKSQTDNNCKIIGHSERRAFNLYQESLYGITKSKYAFLMSNVEHAIFSEAVNHNSLKILSNDITKQSTGFFLTRNNILLLSMNEVIEKLHASGILQFKNDYGLWFKYRPVAEIHEDVLRILSLNDLEFGFVLFLAAAFVSIVVFSCEFLQPFMKRQLIKLIGLYEFLNALEKVLNVYHDKWYIKDIKMK